ncbi:MAG TPA: SulP family inorganic anion transporter [Candidatus Obscuribacterales bacterium]
MSENKDAASKSDLRQDFLASIVVFLVALPLCMGIAIACGVPPAQGLISGIVGGIIVGMISGVPLQVSGPAAGLTVLVWDVVQRHGVEALAVVVLVAGGIQLAAGLLKLGRWFRAVSPAVVNGMLAGIGILLVASQFHVMFDLAPKSSGLPNLIAIPGAIWNAITFADGAGHFFGAGLGFFTLAVLFLWKKFHLDEKSHLPGHLPAIAGATLIALAFQLPVKYVDVPDSLIKAINFTGFDALGHIIEAPILLAALSMALIASAETLLSATAVDQMHQGPRARYDKELVAQGVGNMLCGFLGALPITGVIARSTVNVQSGARSRRSAIFHGVWILLAVMLLPFVLKLIPTASLGALLVFTGFKLIDVSVIRKLRAFGHSQAAIYAATVGMIVTTDLLAGVLVGFTLSLIRLILTMTDLNVEQHEDKEKKTIVLEVKGTATFLGLPRLAEPLEALPAGLHVRVIVDDLVFIDHACLELLANFERRHKAAGGTVEIDWNRLRERSASPADVK